MGVDLGVCDCNLLSMVPYSNAALSGLNSEHTLTAAIRSMHILQQPGSRHMSVAVEGSNNCACFEGASASLS